ncbi:hypothetical protein [Streptomyces lydicus]|uniref:hypothetical protein n=1 Tax=Streptomyces lydicus TaxID=47763 RepID=UPI0010134D26|nr:hypothetical protein [Streptomyces lydicus]MCZ1006346.1 hypothetical protein [Streptomyces lydicus]
MKLVAWVGIAAAVLAVVAAAIVLVSLHRQAAESRKPATWGDVERIRELALSVDGRARWVAWLTVANAVLGFIGALMALADNAG